MWPLINKIAAAFSGTLQQGDRVPDFSDSEVVPYANNFAEWAHAASGALARGNGCVSVSGPVWTGRLQSAMGQQRLCST
jgi:hypothetical protein